MINEMIPVYMSVGRPHLPAQQQFLDRLQAQLSASGFEPKTLGVTQYSYLSPLEAIRRLMNRCAGAVVVGLERTHCLIGYDRQGSADEREFTHRRLSTVWCHLEAGMAFQVGLPLLILRDSALQVEGILDPAISGHFVFSVDLSEVFQDLPMTLRELIKSWGEDVRERYAGHARREPKDWTEIYLDLQPGAVERPSQVEDILSSALRQLRSLTRSSPRDTRLEFANYEARLVALTADKKRFGPSETIQSEISRVVYELNRLCLDHFDKTFVELAET